MQDKITLTSHCFLHAIALSVFVYPLKALGSQGHIFILSVLLPSTNLPIDAPLCPWHPLNEAPVFPSLRMLDPDSAPTFPWREGRQGVGKAFLPPSERRFVSAGRGTALESVL